MKHIKSILTVILLSAMTMANGQTLNHPQSDVPLVDPVSNCSLRYYYYPNLQAYFDTKKNIYIYCEKGVWTEADEIPAGYMGYSLYNKVSVFITDYEDDNITQFINVHKKQYPYVNHAKARMNAMVSQK